MCIGVGVAYYEFYYAKKRTFILGVVGPGVHIYRN
jgi:hypothetical protein